MLGGSTGGRRAGPRSHAAAAALLGAALLSGCAAVEHAAAPPTRPAPGSGPARAAEWMPPAARSAEAWLAQVDRAYDHAVAGRSAERWLRLRMAQRHPGERLAVVMGVDDVMVATHDGGIGTLVPRSVRFVRTAHRLGYAVFYVTGRSAATGLGAVEATLGRSGVPATGFCGRPTGAADEETGKAQCRATIESRGFTLAMEVAASEASFDGAPLAEREIRLPDFALSG